MTLRRTPLTRRTPLRARTPMPRARTTRQPVRATAATRTVLARTSTGPTAEQRQLVIDRAWGYCEMCGTRVLTDLNRALCAYSIHHRRPRGMGGTRRPDTNSPANLLLVCGDATAPGGCHAWIETNRAEALRRGLLVRSTADPATVPVQLEGGDWVLLTHDGRRADATGSTENGDA